MDKKPRFPAPGGEVGRINVAHEAGDNELNILDMMPKQNRNSQERRARHLLGLDIEWNLLNGEERGNILQSRERMTAYDNIDTTTTPRGPKIREKQGIVSEITRNNLLSEELLQTSPTVYLASGDDIDYPLALGARNIELVDPAFANPKAIESLERRLSRILGKTIKLDNKGSILVEFDYGKGLKNISIRVSPKFYIQEEQMGVRKTDTSYNLPKEVGLVILFASQGPNGSIQHDREIEQRIIAGGAILDGRTLTKYPKGPNGNAETIELGREEE